MAVSLTIVLSLAAISGTSYSPVIGDGENGKHKDIHDKGNVCGCLVAEFEKLNNVVNDGTLTGKQFDAVEDLRPSLCLISQGKIVKYGNFTPYPK